MKKIFIIVLCTIGIIGQLSICSCSVKTNSENSIYDWPCPIEGIAWGTSKEELIHYYKCDKNEYEEKNYSQNRTRLLPVEKIKVYGYKATLYFDFDQDYGLTLIYIKYNDKNVDGVTKTLIDQYGKGSVSGFSIEDLSKVWYGSSMEDLDPTVFEKYQSHLKKLGVSQHRINEDLSLPFVCISWDIGSSSPTYGVCRISANRAAVLEHVLKE